MACFDPIALQYSSYRIPPPWGLGFNTLSELSQQDPFLPACGLILAVVYYPVTHHNDLNNQSNYERICIRPPIKWMSGSMANRIATTKQHIECNQPIECYKYGLRSVYSPTIPHITFSYHRNQNNTTTWQKRTSSKSRT